MSTSEGPLTLAGYMPTREEYDRARRIAENLQAQLDVRDSTIATLEKALAAVTSERDAARAEVARLNKLVVDLIPAISEHDYTRFYRELSAARAALRGDTAPAGGEARP